MKTKVLCLALCLALLLAALPLALGEADAPAQPTRRLRLGSSVYTIEIDGSYQYGNVTEEDAAEGQVAYLYSDRLAVDFDVYQVGADGEHLPLEECVAKAAAARGNAEGIVADGQVNGIPAGWFRTTQSYEGVDYQTVSYVLDNGEGYLEIVFWLDGEDAETLVQGMINTLAYDNLAPVQLGSSPYWVFCSASFRQGDMTDEDRAENQVAYWVSDETLLDFDVYQFSKEGLPEELTDYVAAEAEKHSTGDTAVVGYSEVNGIPMGWYRAVEAYEGRDYKTLTCVLDAGREYVEVVFWLDGLTAEAEADGILLSLWMDEEAGAGTLTEAMDDFLTQLAVANETWAADAAAGLEEAAEAGEAWVADAAAGLEEAAEAGEAWVADAATGLREALEAAGEQAAEAVEGAKESVEAAGEQAAEAVEGAKESVEAAGEQAAEAVEGAKEGVEAAREQAAEAVEGAKESIEAARKQAIEDVKKRFAGGEVTQVLRLGTSPFTLVVPAGFTEGQMTQEDIEDDQVGYYYSTDTQLDFDVYQFSKDGYPDDLPTYVEEETSGYNSVSELVANGEVNGIPAAWYRTVEVYQEAEFNTLTYILDGGNEYVEICFWLDGDNADAEADAIIRTLGREAGADPFGGRSVVIVDQATEDSSARQADAGAPGVADEQAAEGGAEAEATGEAENGAAE